MSSVKYNTCGMDTYKVAEVHGLMWLLVVADDFTSYLRFHTDLDYLQGGRVTNDLYLPYGQL